MDDLPTKVFEDIAHALDPAQKFQSELDRLAHCAVVLLAAMIAQELADRKGAA